MNFKMNEKNKKITWLIFVVIIKLTYTLPSCADINFCMACSETEMNVCESCFNWGVKTFAIIDPMSYDPE